MELFDQIEQSKSAIQKIWNSTPEVGIILGTGLGGFAGEIEQEAAIAYKDIPHFPVSTAPTHTGRMICGKIGSRKVVAMEGRFHFYEGYTMQQITLPVRVLKALGCKRLFLSNAAGGTNPDFQIGEIMIIRDHINLFPSNPLIGKNDDELGPRFPDMSEPYDKKLIALAKQIASENGIRVKEGVYAGLSGPCFETPAEYKYIHIIGGDAVGMSTVPEVIVARHSGIPCFAVSIITDLGIDGKIVEVSHEEVQKVAAEAEPRMTTIIRELLSRS